MGYGRFDDQPGWHSYDVELAHGATVAGQVTDNSGKPVSGVQVHLSDAVADNGGRYRRPEEYATVTDAEGQFRLEQVPRGKATVRLTKRGYVGPGLGTPTTVPATGLALTMLRSATVRVTVDFAGRPRPEAYIVEIVPEGGEAVGKWSGSGQIDKGGQITFEDVPAGRYVVRGRPNPSRGDDETEGIAVELTGGETEQLRLTAR